jgi:hypothetical protein
VTEAPSSATPGRASALGPGPAPTPAAGSTAWFVILYGGAHRDRLRCLFALADEIAASLDPRLDHHVAHVRLGWWGEESERFARGESRHPWARALAGSALELPALVSAAELALARGTLPQDAADQIPPEPFARAVFLACAQTLHPPPMPASIEQPLRGLAAALAAALPASAPATPALQPTLPPEAQPALAPVLVWAALARRRHLSHTALAGSRAQLLGDNLRAWRAARAAARGRFHP